MQTALARAALVLLAGASTAAWAQEPVRTIRLDELDLTKMSAGWGAPRAGRSIIGEALKIGGRTFDQGVGTHASSRLTIALDGRARRFSARVGVDDETAGKGSVRFRIYGDGRRLFDSGVIKGGAQAQAVAIDLRGLEQLLLLVGSGGDGISYDHADWAAASFEYTGAPPRAIDPPPEPAVLLTPRPGPKPRLNGPRLFGVRPGHPFVMRIPCTGERPMRFAVQDLPAGLTLDAERGILRGRAPAKPGRYTMTLRATNARASASRPFTLVVGDTLALTPPMGWNSWYIHYNRVTQAHMVQAAEAMVASGMADHGYMYVNIDDCWMKRRGDEPYRDERGAVLPNAKFPDIAAMVRSIHEKGLRAGIYISPGPWTCAGYTGSYQHEEADAVRFAEWGFDFLKYDWCSYGKVASGEGLARLQAPYRKMSAILARLDRDIVLNLCQYGMGEVWKWGGEVGGQCWRTTGDLGLEQGGRLPGFYHIALSNARHWKEAGPGRWNDPDYLLIGWVGSARGMGPGRPTALTPSEQYSYMSLWCLMAAPLIFSGDMAHLDEFTLNVLCNAEVIAIDQDPLGRQASIIRRSEDELVLAKPLEDGSLAVGLFNLGEFAAPLRATWKELGLEGPQQARDLWRWKDLGRFDGSFTAPVPRHGVALIRLQPVR